MICPECPYTPSGFCPDCKTWAFKVAAVSTNTGSFGHKRTILIAPDGVAWAIDVSGSSFHKPARGDVVRVAHACGNHHLTLADPRILFECPERLDNAPPGVAAEVWK